mgnify:CR=1 FL=1
MSDRQVSSRSDFDPVEFGRIDRVGEARVPTPVPGPYMGDVPRPFFLDEENCGEDAPDGSSVFLEGAGPRERLYYDPGKVKCAIVTCGGLCPGINDGPELERTMRDLASLAPHALTVALVPVGLTKYREHLYPLRPYTQEEAEQVIRQAEAFQKEMLAAHGTRFVFPSDEFYQIAKHPLPDVDSYEDFPQFENGVGLLCRLKDEYETAIRLDPDEGQAEKRRVIMACGTSVAPFLRELITSHPVSGVDIRIKPIVNYFFGETVTVSGLITGQDLVAQLKGEEADEILITESMLRQGEEIFLDDMTLEQAQRQLGIRITPVPDDGADLLYALRGTEE